MAPKYHELMHVQEETKEVNVETVNEALPFYMLFSYADTLDWTIMALGTFGSIIHGMAQPVGYLLLGKALNAFVDNTVDIDAMVKALKKRLDDGCMQVKDKWPDYVVALTILVTRATYTKKMNEISATKTIYISEATPMTISQIKIVFAFLGENSMIKSFSEILEKQFSLSKGEALIKGVGTGMLQSVTFCAWALIIWIGSIVVTSRKAEGGDVIAAVMSILFSFVSLTFAAPDIQIFNQAKAAGYEVFKMYTLLIPSRPEKLILEGFSLSISAEKMVALVGNSGCGNREILIDNYNIKDLDLKFIRKNIGVVSQEPSPFAGTIKDNIKVGNMDASDQQVWDAAIMANAHMFVTQLLNQYSTEAMQGRTVILIAHRMSTIINADIIAVVENGQVTETRTHRSLLDSSKFYKNLFSIQNIGQIRESRACKDRNRFHSSSFCWCFEACFRILHHNSRISILQQRCKVASRKHYFYGVVGEKAMGSIRKALYLGILRNELAWFEKPKNNVGSLTSRAMMPCHFIGGLIQAKSAKGFAGFSLCLWNIAHAVALWYTTILVSKHQSRFEDGIGSYQIFSLTVPSITELWMLIPAVISIINVLTPAFKTLDRKTEIEPDAPQDTKLKMIKGKIEFQNVKFNYLSRPEVTVLNKFSLQIEPGTKVALVGPSGAGKSSVLAILLRFYDPNQGRVLIDETNIKEYNLKTLRKQIGLVQQKALLFSSTLRDNICYGAKQASEAEIVEVSTEANIHEFISNLPDGYNTLVGDKGCQLSGGQKQRVAIARTLLKRPRILLLDEATSAIDTESERTVVNALESIDRRKGNCGKFISNPTQIIVAHRLSIVVNSDVILVMDKCEIVETGSHLTLISTSDGVYSRLFHIQNEI
ncbi:hypothetical protein GOBAR_DD02354 [Gossypium barbadense]|nr:hypothetical protein GOBAR_DD02354 [Gossypium barbadense]